MFCQVFPLQQAPCIVTKLDATGGTFGDSPLISLPKIHFYINNRSIGKRELDTGIEGYMPIEYSPYVDYPWEQIGSDFNPLGPDLYPLGALYSNFYLGMIPYEGGQDEFD